MNKYNCAAFDGTINKYPNNYTDKIIFYKKNISPIRSNTTANLSYFTKNFNNIFLKMDIEGSEYSWMLSLTEDQLKKFKQIVIEFHGINDNSWNTNLSDKIKCFEKLSNTHYAVHIHGNNYGNLTKNIPNTVEITYIRKDTINYYPELNKQLLPINGLDFPNNPNKSDFDLNFIISKYKKLNFIILINEYNLGLPKSLNKGLCYCNNDIVFRMDADDIMFNDRLEKILDIMEEINIQEWDGLQYDPISDKTKVELALIDLYNRLAMQIPANHQEILDELAEKLLPQEASLTVKQVAGSLDASVSETKLRVEANSPYNDGWTKQFYEKELVME